MPIPVTNSGIRDNHSCGSVADFLRPHLKNGAKLSVVPAYFTIYAYEALKEHLDKIDHMNFLFGEPTFVKSLDPDKTEKKEFVLDGDGLKLANTLQQKRVFAAFEIAPTEFELLSLPPETYREAMRDSITGKGRVGLVQKRVFLEQGKFVATVKIAT